MKKTIVLLLIIAFLSGLACSKDKAEYQANRITSDVKGVLDLIFSGKTEMVLDVSASDVGIDSGILLSGEELNTILQTLNAENWALVYTETDRGKWASANSFEDWAYIHPKGGPQHCDYQIELDFMRHEANVICFINGNSPNWNGETISLEAVYAIPAASSDRIKDSINRIAGNPMLD